MKWSREITILTNKGPFLLNFSSPVSVCGHIALDFDLMPVTEGAGLTVCSTRRGKYEFVLLGHMPRQKWEEVRREGVVEG